MYAGRLSARAVAISRSISWAQLSGVITAETHAACAEMFAEVLEHSVTQRVVNDLADPLAAHRRHADEVKTHDRSALAPITPLSADISPTALRGHQHRTTAHAGVNRRRVPRV